MSALAAIPTTRFELPNGRAALVPAEQRGIERDGIRLLVATSKTLHHTTFAHLAEHLAPGDLVVVNVSGTLAAEVDAVDAERRPVVLHLATALDDGSWVVEIRTSPGAARPVLDAAQDAVLRLPENVRLRLLEAYACTVDGRTRLWRARLLHVSDVAHYLGRVGRPISYGHLAERRPLRDYQTVFSAKPGSAEMPSAGRGFTDRLVTGLAVRGVRVAPITLHTGVSSQEAGEGPQPEWFEVPAETAELVNHTIRDGHRVVAVDTTATRALESAATTGGVVRAARGWTDVVIGPGRPVRVVRGLVTGLHTPQASHLLLVEAVAGSARTQAAYDEAVREGYLWHEFGDACLLLP